MHEFIFTWSIENISYSWQKTGEQIVSPIFSVGPIQNSAWTLRLYPRGIENSDYLSLFLRREVDSVPEDLAVNFELSCLSADASTLRSCYIPETFKTFAKGGDVGFGELCFMSRHEVFGRRKYLYLPLDTLTLRCRIWKDGEGVHEFGQSFGRTCLVIERIFSADSIKLETPTIKTLSIESKLKNKLLMSINVCFYDHKLDVSINLINTEHMKSTTLKLSFVDKRRNVKLCEQFCCWLSGPHQEVFCLPFSSKMEYIDSKKLEECCFEFITELIYSTGDETQTLENTFPLKISDRLSKYINGYIPPGTLTDEPNISKDLWNLYVEQVLCDVKLNTQQRSLYVHKTVLCARSPVFLAMLTGDMKEKINNCIEIEDISADTLEKFVFFLYNDAFEDLEWDSVIRLYYAADKYQVVRLKLLCCSHFLRNVDVENVCELLILADRHHDSELKRKIDAFVWKNDEEIFRSSTWQKFVYEQQNLAMKTMLSKYEEKDNQSLGETYDDRISIYPKFQDNLRNLYQNRIVSDIVIKTNCTLFPAHKTVLCASSLTFKEMFTNDLSDNSMNIFDVKDLEEDTVSRMLFFLYTNSLKDLQWDIVVKLYHAANTYQIQRLKFKCSCFLLENVRISNAIDLLLLAHEHHDVKLKLAVKDYICFYDEEIFGSEEWAEFSKSNLQLANETMRSKYTKDSNAVVSNSH